MKIAFVYMGAENLGIEYLSAAAKKSGHDVRLFYDPAVFHGHIMWDIAFLAKIFNLKNKMVAEIAAWKPDVTAFSCVTSNYQWALEFARDVKAALPHAKVVFGGPHVNAASDAVINEKNIDGIITGEADEEFPRFIDLFGNEQGAPGAGVRIKRNGEILSGAGIAFVDDLNRLPWPDKKLFFQKVPAMEEHYVIMTSRGCPYDCTYCYTKLGEEGPGGRKHRVRRRTVENVMAEFDYGISARTKRVIFRDDIFAINHDWLAEFTVEYKGKVNRPYYCYAHPVMVDRDIADLLKESGCCLCTMGVQSADDGQRRKMLNRRYDNDQVRATVSLLKERGITVSLDHIMGIPGDTVEMMETAALFYSEMKPDRLFAFWLTYYPGTKMLAMSRDMGILDDNDVRCVSEGKIGSRFSGGGAKHLDPVFIKLAALIASTPLLPGALLKLIVRKKLYRFFPAKYGLTNIIVSLNALKTGDMFFKYALKTTLFSKKYVP